MVEFLKPYELAELTGKKPNQKAAQVRALQAMGIRHWVRPDGKPVVLRSTLEDAPNVANKKRSETEPNFKALK